MKGVLRYEAVFPLLSESVLLLAEDLPEGGILEQIDEILESYEDIRMGCKGLYVHIAERKKDIVHQRISGTGSKHIRLIRRWLLPLLW